MKMGVLGRALVKLLVQKMGDMDMEKSFEKLKKHFGEITAHMKSTTLK